MKKATKDRQKTDVLTKSHHRSYVSQSGLAAVLKSVKENGLPEGISRSTIKRKRDAALPDDLFVMESVPTKKSNEPAEVWLVHPILLLQHLCATKKSIAELMTRALEEHHEFLRITVYTDEVLPGNALKPRNDRKLISFYWSLMDFGGAVNAEDCWMHLTTLRASVARELQGGWSQLFKVVLKSFFQHPYDFSKGVMLDILGHGAAFCKAKVAEVVGDEAALQGCWSFKGASGQMPCFLCRNITLDRLEIAQNDASAVLVSHVCTDIHRIQFHTDDSMKECVQLLKDNHGQTSQAHFTKMQQALGLNFEPDGALFSSDLEGKLMGGPVSVTHYDWMHCYVVSGVWNTEAGYFLEKIKPIASVKSIHEFIKKLNWPKRISSTGVSGKTCLAKHDADGSEVKCSASEALSVYPALRLFVLETIQEGVSADIDAARKSFLAVCQVLDLLTSKKYTKDSLLAAIQFHLRCRLGAYGSSRCQPKCHYVLHLPFFVNERTQTLQACWIHERKHKELKRFATDASNTNRSHAWEKSLLKQVVLSQTTSLEEGSFIRAAYRLGVSKPATSDLVGYIRGVLQLGPFAPAAVDMSSSAFLENEIQVWSKDLVLVSKQDGTEQVGEVWFFLSCNDTHKLVCWCPFHPLGNNRFQRKENPCLETMDCIKRPLIFGEEDDGRILIAP